MAATEVSLTDAAWVELGATPLHVELKDSAEVIVAVGTVAPSNGSVVGPRLSLTPPRLPFFRWRDASTKVFARADKGSAKVIVQTGA